jgi:hypothetical protein
MQRMQKDFPVTAYLFFLLFMFALVALFLTIQT